MDSYRRNAPESAWADEPEPEADAPRTNWWLRLTSKGWDELGRTIQERELTRRSQFAAWIILGLFILDALLIGTNYSNTTTVLAGIVAAIGFLIAAMLNRAGLVSLAGSLLVLLIIGAILGSVIFQGADPINNSPAGQLEFANLPSYDLLAAATVVAAAILPRWALFFVMTLNIGLILGDFFFQPQNALLHAYVTGGGAASLLLLPIMLQILLTLIAFLWVQGTDNAIRRADRAEELAAMEHQLVEQKRQIDLGIQQILQTHIRAANGDFSARAPLGQDNALFQIASSLNNLLNRLSRSAQSQFQMQRTAQEIGRLRDSLLAAQSGRPPLWPMPSGTPVDQLLEVIVPSERMLAPGVPQLSGTGGFTAGGSSGPLGVSGGLGGRGYGPAPYHPTGQAGPFGPSAPSGPNGGFGQAASPGAGQGFAPGGAPNPFQGLPVGGTAPFGQPGTPFNPGSPGTPGFGTPGFGAPGGTGGFDGGSGPATWGMPTGTAGLTGTPGPSGQSGPSYMPQPAPQAPQFGGEGAPFGGNSSPFGGAPARPPDDGGFRNSNGDTGRTQVTGAWDMPPLPDALDDDISGGQ